MPRDLAVPHLSYKAVGDFADQFLQKYHPQRSVPVPIEEILSLQLRVDIVPLPGLHELIEADGFTSSDLTTIFVEDCVHENRYRFTLAHEAGHVFMHSLIYQNAMFEDTEDWIDFVKSMSEFDHSRLEYQAYCFAGLLLVPTEHLAALASRKVAALRDEGISLTENRDFAWSCIAASLSRLFLVSDEVIRRRLDYEGIPDACARIRD